MGPHDLGEATVSKQTGQQGLDRRVLLTGLALGVSAAAVGHAQTVTNYGENDIALWDAPPGVPSTAPATPLIAPLASVFAPANPNGVGIVLFQGGGYQRVGRSIAVPRYFQERGYTVFDILYRLPAAGWTVGPDVALQDAQQAMRLVRARAVEWKLDPTKIGVMGFSSGGHLAGSIATRFAEELAPAGSAYRGADARPAFALLGCPVVTMDDPFVHKGSRQQMFGDARDTVELAKRSVEKQVTANTPPTFLVHAADDTTVPPNNSIMLFEALKAAKVPVEMHIFQNGGHSLGAGFTPNSPLSAFPGLMVNWLTARGYPKHA